jgi:hypothetical protein
MRQTRLVHSTALSSTLAVLLALLPLPIIAWSNGIGLADCLAFGNDQPEHIFSSSVLWAGINIDPGLNVRAETHMPLTSGGTFPIIAKLGDWNEDPVGSAAAARVLAWAITALGVVSLLLGGVRCAGAQQSFENGLLLPLSVASMAGTLAMSGAWYGGFVNFTIGAAAAMALMAWASVDSPWAARRSGLVAAALLAVGFLHLFAAAIAGLWVLIHQLSTRGKETWWRTLLRVVLIGAPVLMLQVLVTFSFRSGEVLNPEELQWELRSPLLALGTLPIGGPWWRAAPPALLAVVGIVHSLARPAPRGRQALAVWAGMLMIAGYLLPVSMPGWSWMSPRLAWMGIVGGLACLVGMPARLQAAIATIAISWTLAGALWSADLGLRWQQSPCSHLATIAHSTGDLVPDALKGVLVIGSCLDPGSSFDEPGLPHFQFGAHLAAELAAYEGGFPLGFGAHKSIHAWTVSGAISLPLGHQRSFVTPGVLLSADVAPSDAPLADGALTRIAQLATAYAGPVIVGNEPFLDRIAAWGFIEIYRGERIRRLLWQGCPLELELTPGVPVGWRSGWLPLNAPLHEGERAESNGGSVVLGPTGCGPIWVEVRDGQGRACAEADPNGWLVVDTRQQNRVRCTRPALP